MTLSSSWMAYRQTSSKHDSEECSKALTYSSKSWADFFSLLLYRNRPIRIFILFYCPDYVPIAPFSHSRRSPDTFFLLSELNIHEKEKSRGACVSLFRLFVKLWKKKREKGELDILSERAALFFVLLLLLFFPLFISSQDWDMLSRCAQESFNKSTLLSRAQPTIYESCIENTFISFFKEKSPMIQSQVYFTLF